jgi:1-acyl-sn-glycerol-3-phosphate acyltransferase
MTGDPRTLRIDTFWRVLRRLAEALLLGQRWRIDVRGLEHVPREGGAFLAFNHHSYLDFVLVAWAIVRRLGRPVRFLAKREMWSGPTRLVVLAAKAVPVDRDRPDSRHAALATAVDRLRDGELVAVAPEQTISRSYELLPLRTGAARMAQAAGVPLVPAVGWGSHRAAGKGTGVRPVIGLPVSVAYGEPIHVGADDDPVDVTRRLEEAMTALLDELWADYPDGSPAGAWWVPARLGGGAPPHEEVLAEERARRGGADVEHLRDEGARGPAADGRDADHREGA